MLNRILHVIGGMKNLEKIITITIATADRIAEISDVSASEYLRDVATEIEGRS